MKFIAVRLSGRGNITKMVLTGHIHDWFEQLGYGKASSIWQIKHESGQHIAYWDTAWRRDSNATSQTYNTVRLHMRETPWS